MFSLLCSFYLRISLNHNNEKLSQFIAEMLNLTNLVSLLCHNKYLDLVTLPYIDCCWEAVVCVLFSPAGLVDGQSVSADLAWFTNALTQAKGRQNLNCLTLAKFTHYFIIIDAAVFYKQLFLIKSLIGWLLKSLQNAK